MTIGVEGGVQGRCANHVERVAVGTCERCGSYYCASCYKQLGDRRICSACLAIPRIDYLADARNKAWGKRDGWVWYLGVMFPLTYASIAVDTIRQGGDLVLAFATLVVAAIFVCYLLMLPWSRKAVFLAIPFGSISAIVGAPNLATASAYELGEYTGRIIGRTLILMLFAFAAYNSTRNKLAFKIEVTDAELARYYQKYLANPAAKRALAYGLASLLVPLLVPVAVVAGVRSLRKMDAKAWPPVTGRGMTLFGLVAAGLSVLLWTILAIDLISKR